MKRTSFNNEWYFSPEWNEKMLFYSKKDAASLKQIRLPHTVCRVPFNSFDQAAYQMVSSYLKFFDIPSELREKRFFLCFDGAAHQADVWCNGNYVGSHHNGYTGFRLELTKYVNFGGENRICVKLDSREIDVPPFGGVIDYLTYGGLYREAWLDVCNQSYISDIFIRGKADGTFCCSVKSEKKDSDSLQIKIYDSCGKVQHIESINKDGELKGIVRGAVPWTLEDPVLYTAVVSLSRENVVIDEKAVRFGFRTADFRKDGFYLNGKKILIRGLDRHQSWPYMGYAVPERAQKLDADILKYELGCNGVRTSHYPQSHHFLSRCDEVGLLVFTELPGWQHIGDEQWQQQALQNVREMVSQYRNHPSVILWGVRINESKDDDAFYQETNRIAHSLDDSRATGGVRNFRGSHLYEDVYTYNDFSHTGNNAGCEPKSAITSDPEKPYLVSEYMGHIFPTKPFDDEPHRTEHALRHAKVLNDIAAQPDIAGSFGWCMFDYNTHPEFGSGDGICYHGVMDMFRNPKPAAAVYASQSDDKPVLELSSTMDIGDWPAFGVTAVAAFTNGDEVRLYRNQEFVKSFYPSSEYSSLPHPPIIIDDFIGVLLETREGYDEETSLDLKKVIYAFVNYAKEPFSPDVLAAKQRLNNNGISDKAIADLQNRYMTYWGQDGIVSWHIQALKGGREIASRTITPPHEFRLDVRVDSQLLYAEESWDMATVRIAVLDEHSNLQHYCQRALRLRASGAIELVGPKYIPLAGGMAGCYVKTNGKTGRGKLIIEADGIEPVIVKFQVH